jgi:uncharacterized membrane protein YkvA (DUF1232 family)
MSSEHAADWRPDDDATHDDATHEAARESVRRNFWSKLGRVAARIPFSEDLLAAYYCAFDRDTPRHVQASLIGALVYFILPFDVLPDMMVALGYTDDMAVLAGVLRLVSAHITPKHRDAARAALARGLTGE